VTLVEIMVVVAVIAAFTVMALPSFLSFNENERVKQAARAVGDSFGLARSEAIRTGNNHLVVFENALGAPDPIVIVNDGLPAAANCTIAANEIVHRVPAIRDVTWGTSTDNANGTAAPSDMGRAVPSIPSGSSFSDASMAPAKAATWVLFQADGIPRLFTPLGGNCNAISGAGTGGGAIYVTNGQRDYAVVLRPLGTFRVHRWMAGNGAWSS
jgi:type II secretory pathway pseudopilin PulG